MPTKPMLIEVTRLDINKGEPLGEYTCPIALALQRNLKLPKADIRVWSISLNLDVNEHQLNWRYPNYVKTWVREFDANLPVAPFSFKLPAYLVTKISKHKNKR